MGLHRVWCQAEVEKFNEIYQYDPDSGLITYKKTMGKSKAGSPAYTQFNGRNKLQIKCRSKAFRASISYARLAYLLHTGQQPEFIMHVDGDCENNRFDNLRVCDNTEASKNRYYRNGKYLRGVSKSGNKFRATITHEGKQKHLGTFATELEAHLAYRQEHYKLTQDTGFNVFENRKIDTPFEKALAQYCVFE